MKQTIEKKNKMLKTANDDMQEIYLLARVLRHAEAPDDLYRTLVQTVADKIALASYDYDKYGKESKVGLPEEPTEEEMAASREVNGDD